MAVEEKATPRVECFWALKNGHMFTPTPQHFSTFFLLPLLRHRRRRRRRFSSSPHLHNPGERKCCARPFFSYFHQTHWTVFLFSFFFSGRVRGRDPGGEFCFSLLQKGRAGIFFVPTSNWPLPPPIRPSFRHCPQPRDLSGRGRADEISQHGGHERPPPLLGKT